MPAQSELEALKFFALLTLTESENTMRYYKARSSGGMIVGTPRMLISTAQEILRDAKAVGLRLDYPEGAEPIVVFVPDTGS